MDCFGRFLLIGGIFLFAAFPPTVFAETAAPKGRPLASGGISAEANPAKLFERAVKAYRLDDFSTALSLFNKYLKDNPNSLLADDASSFRDDCNMKLGLAGNSGTPVITETVAIVAEPPAAVAETPKYSENKPAPPVVVEPPAAVKETPKQPEYTPPSPPVVAYVTPSKTGSDLKPATVSDGNAVKAAKPEIATIVAEPSVAVDETPRFDINRFTLEGNTILPAEKTAVLLAENTGPKRDFADIQMTIERLEKSYRDQDYTMVAVILPEQELTNGEVKLRAIEPRVKEIKIEGNKHFDNDNITASLPTLKKGESPQITAISENLKAANENPARKMTLQFKAQDDPKELQAVLQVQDQKPWKLTLSGDNTGSDATGRYRTSVGFQHFNLFNMDHVAALQYTTSPDHIEKVNIVSGSYRLPLYKLGDTLDVFGAYSDVDSGTTPTAISGIDAKVSGKGIVTGFRYNMNLPRAGNYEQKLVGGMDYRLYDNSAVIQGTDLAKDVVAHPLSLTYGGTWTAERLVVDGSLGLLYNIPWGQQGEKSDFAAVRGAAANYFIFRYGLNIMARPGADWIVRVATNGQYTPDRLIPGEQFGYGGSSVLRGYEEREESWDSGFSGSLELYSPDIAPLMQIPKSQFRLLGFFDGGTGYNLRPQTGDQDGNALKSIGAGFRLGVGEYFSFSLDWGYALDHSVQTKRGGNAVHFKGQLAY